MKASNWEELDVLLRGIKFKYLRRVELSKQVETRTPSQVMANWQTNELALKRRLPGFEGKELVMTHAYEEY